VTKPVCKYQELTELEFSEDEGKKPHGKEDQGKGDLVPLRQRSSKDSIRIIVLHDVEKVRRRVVGIFRG
jgi:hypothetical protein